ncbi:MAG: acetyl-CoA acetyltransferase [Candidatus Binatia bacterium]|nr:acetyl-CoA acetyltransferase [Candidatus Binatia bacterium]
MSDDRTPVLVGTGQLVERNVDPKEAIEPLLMLEQCAKAAAADAGAGENLLRSIDTLAVLNVAGWQARNPAQIVGEKLGSNPTHTFTSEMGGQIGVTATNLIAERITKGETKISYICGANNMRTLMKAGGLGIDLNWTVGGTSDPEMIGIAKNGSSDLEGKYGMVMPPDIYPMFENAMRASRGLDLETHKKSMGDLFTKFTDVAAANPYAWFPTARSSEELTTATPTNRMIAFPYTKYLNAVLNTDQAAGYFLMSVEAAKSLGISPDRWLYWWGGAKSQEEAWYPTSRPNFAECPAMLDTHTAALGNAGVTVNDIDRFDFYSCFPVAVEMALKNLNISEDDPRGFTVTGGLPYGGGPASGYTLHSVATMADRLRETPGKKGLVTGNGWYLTKHSASVWSTEPKPGALPTAQMPEKRASADVATTPLEVAEDCTGGGTIETYTAVYDRAGAPERGIIAGRSDDGRRFVANTPGDKDLLLDLVSKEGVGRKGSLSVDGGMQIFTPS